jgi:hypothetical protein
MGSLLDRSKALLTLAGIVILASCASGGGSRAASEPDQGPRRITSDALPPIMVAGPSPTQGPPTLLSIDVEVDENGSPDMSTFRISGPAASENRDRLADWMQRQRFAPATKEGVPIRSHFKMRLKT